MDCRTFLQNEAKNARLTIEKIRKNFISEYTCYEDKLFFFDYLEEYIR
jgi:hypothetical protein